MAKGISINIGLNLVDPAHYGGWDGRLAACEFDADDMAGLAQGQGMEVRKVLAQEATAAGVTSALTDAADELDPGDLALVTYSGHGGQVRDTNGDEPDRLDETWVLYDRQLVDDELFALYARFKPGVRIVVLSDSCHSGTVTRQVLAVLRPDALQGALDVEGPVDEHNGMKALPERVARSTYEAHKDLYDSIQASVPANDRTVPAASILLMSGCQDNQTSADGRRNGLFTQTMLGVWNNGKFDKGGYRGLWKKTVERMPPWQSPNFFTAGAPDRAFERQRPFSI